MNDELLIKFLLKETDEIENKRIADWLAENAEHGIYFEQLKKIWLTAASLNNESTINVDQAWLNFKAKVKQTTLKQPIVPTRRLNIKWLSIAALFILAIGTWVIFEVSTKNSYTELVSTNKVLKEKLPDGSLLTFNKNSAVSFASNFEQNRHVQLKKGEVFFNVVPDKAHPFVINIDQVAVSVVGTSFNIKRSLNQTSIVVETGIVSVKRGNQEIKLMKGEQLDINSGVSHLEKQPIKDELYNYYRTKMFIAKNTPLHRLISVLNEAYGSHVTVADNVKDLTIYIPLPMGSLEDNLKMICSTLNLKITRNQNQILLSY